jgi:hypothetical protein
VLFIKLGETNFNGVKVLNEKVGWKLKAITIERVWESEIIKKFRQSKLDVRFKNVEWLTLT